MISWVEILGYVASGLVAIALMMASIWRLRLINMVGAILFTIYALLIQAYPVATVNAIIVLINLYHIIKLLRVEEEFEVMDIEADAPYLQKFLAYYRDDIRTYYPNFGEAEYAPVAGQMTFFVLRNLIPVGLFIGREGETGTLVVKLDYVIPGYRDFKVGDFLFRQKRDFFRERGVKLLVSYPGNDAHQAYLKRMGFQRDHINSDKHLYQLKIG